MYPLSSACFSFCLDLKFGLWGVAQLLEGLSGKEKALSLIPVQHKPGVVMHTYGSNAKEGKAEESGVQGHPCLQSK